MPLLEFPYFFSYLSTQNFSGSSLLSLSLCSYFKELVIVLEINPDSFTMHVLRFMSVVISHPML